MVRNTIHLLQTGYSKLENTSFKSSCTVSLIKTGSENILVDTGGCWERDNILKSLKQVGVANKDIGVVICTHGHSDHIGNLNLFADAVQILVYEDGEYSLCASSGIKLLQTPGHSFDDISVFINEATVNYLHEEFYGSVGIVGDLFEHQGDEDSFHYYSADASLQRENREKMIKICSVIIPGHGEPFLSKKCPY